jgi:hypothetical protein
VRFFLEVDRGTEGLDLLVAKVAAYARIAQGIPVLFALTDELRARRLLGALEEASPTVATTTLDRHHADPLGPIWHVRGRHGPVSLLELGGAPAAGSGDEGSGGRP